MFFWMSLLILSMLVSTLFIVIGMLCSKYTPFSREYISPLECGFNSKFEHRSPLSLRFFIFAVVFVIFDVELVLVLPVLFTTSQLLEVAWGFSFMVSFLSFGLYLEWNNKAFDWVE